MLCWLFVCWYALVTIFHCRTMFDQGWLFCSVCIGFLVGFGLVSWLFSLFVLFFVTVFLIILLFDCLFSFDSSRWLSLSIGSSISLILSRSILIYRFFFVWLHFFCLIALLLVDSSNWLLLSPLILLFWCFSFCLVWFSLTKNLKEFTRTNQHENWSSNSTAF